MEIIIIIYTVIVFILIIKHWHLHKRYKIFNEYHNELATLNKRLYMQIKQRQEGIEKSFARQAESIYTAALMGKIAQPIMHDIATPVSALQAAFLMTKNKDENMKRAEKSLEQIIRIVEHARELMLGNVKNSSFRPNELISNVVFVLKDKLQKAEVKLISEIDKNIELNGCAEIFERIIINILLNAIEELENSGKNNKLININSSIIRSYFILEIKDNGRGIKKELVEKIFESSFSSKGENNYGFGLSFVKEMMAKYFKGDIRVKSIQGEYTKFILKFKI